MTAETAKVIPIDPEKEMQEEALTLSEQAKSIIVRDQASFEIAGSFGATLKGLKEKIEHYFAPLKESAHKAHKAICDREKEELKPVNEAITIVRNAANTFLAEQDRLRREEEARLRKIEQDKAAKELERLFAQAMKAEQKGQTDKAEEKLEQAELVYAAPITMAPTVTTNTASTTAQMDTEITVADLKAFLTEIVKRNMAPTMIEVKTAPLKAWVKANGFESFPGLSIRRVPVVRFK